MRPIDYFLRGAARTPAHPFLIGDEETWSFRDAQTLVERIASGLYAAGFERGDSIAVYSPNAPRAVLCVFASMRAGGAWVPVNVRNSAASNGEYMAYTRTRWLFFHSKVAEQARAVIEGLPELRAAVCIDGEIEGAMSLESFCARGQGPRSRTGPTRSARPTPCSPAGRPGAPPGLRKAWR